MYCIGFQNLQVQYNWTNAIPFFINVTPIDM